MNFDLFADPEPIAAAPAAAPAPAPKPAPKEREAFPMQPMPGEVNRWLYKGEIVRYDSKKLHVPGQGRWSNVEGIGRPEVRGDSHADICRWIDERQAAAATKSFADLYAKLEGTPEYEAIKASVARGETE
jgi:hypothetical protein